MSLEADLVEVRKLCKAFAGLANVEAVLNSAVSAEASAKAALKRLEDAELDARKHRAEADRAKHDKHLADGESADVKKKAHAKAANIIAEADRKAKELLDSANKIVESANSEKALAIHNAKVAVDVAKIELDSLNKEIVDATAKLAKIREAIAVVVGK